MHLGQRIQSNRLASNRLGSSQEFLDQPPPQPEAAFLWSNIEALHLADTCFKRPQGNAAGRLFSYFRQQEESIWRGVLAGQSFELLLERLEADTVIERGGVLRLRTSSRSCSLVASRMVIWVIGRILHPYPS
jgi:hypothetical protein